MSNLRQKFDNTLRIIVKYGPIAGLCLNLMMIPSIDFLPFRDPTVTGKFILFSFVSVGQVFLTTFYVLTYCKTIKLNLIDAAIVMIFIIITLNRYLFHPNPGFSIRYYELFALMVQYACLRISINNKNLLLCVIVAIVGADIQLLIGALQLFHFIPSNNDNFSITGSFFNVDPYAGYLSAIAALSIYLIVRFKKVLGNFSEVLKNHWAYASSLKFILYFNIAGTLLLLPAARSRGAVIAIGITCLLIFRSHFFILYKRLQIKSYAKYLMLFVFACSFGLIIWIAIKTNSDSSIGRFFVLKNTIGMIREHPLIGIGYDQFQKEYMLYQARYFNTNAAGSYGYLADNVYYAYNDLLQFIAENGLFGFSVFCFMAFIFFKSYRNRFFLNLAFSGIFCICVFAFFSYTTVILPIKLLLYVLLATYSAQVPSMNIGTSIPLLNKNVFNGAWARIAGVAVCLCCIACFYELFLISTAFCLWRDADVLYYSGDYKKSSALYEDAAKTLKNDGDLELNWAKCLFFLGNSQQAVLLLNNAQSYLNNSVIETTLGDCEAKLGHFQAAEKAYKASIAMVPNRFFSRYLLMELYARYSCKSAATAIARQIIMLPVKVRSEAVDSVRAAASTYLLNNSTTIKK